MRINKYYLLSIFLFITGFVLLGVGVAKGEGTVAIVLFVPVVSGSGILMFLGFICIGLGFLILIFGFFERVSFGEDVYFDLPDSKVIKKLERLGEEDWEEKKDVRMVKRKRTKTGGILLIGPFPIIYGSDRRMAMAMALLTVVILLVVALFLIMLLLRK